MCNKVSLSWANNNMVVSIWEKWVHGTNLSYKTNRVDNSLRIIYNIVLGSPKCMVYELWYYHPNKCHVWGSAGLSLECKWISFTSSWGWLDFVLSVMCSNCEYYVVTKWCNSSMSSMTLTHTLKDKAFYIIL